MKNGKISKKSAKKIVESIWKDICRRSGGDHFLGDLDEDIENEIKESWTKIITGVKNE